jgi:glycosyltransferase involved in cell wall biosynthesis
VSRPARVGFNGLFLDPGVSGGSETYLRSLVPALIAAFPDVSFELATTRRGAVAIAAEPWSAELAILRLPCDDDEPVRRTLLEHARLPRLARGRRWDVMHSLANRAPRRAGVATVVTIHDVIFFHHRTMGAVSTHGMRWAVRAAAAGADEVISGSEAAADEIASTLGLDRDRITAVPHGPGRPVSPPRNVADVLRRHELDDTRFVLCVSAKRPHKNQRVLVDALPRLAGDVNLVLVGHDEGYGSELRDRAESLGVTARVRLLEYLPDEELEALWAAAGCAALPTRAEGFGLPVLEALRRAKPVACSDIAVLREVAGTAAHYFDPEDGAAAAAAIEAALADTGARTQGPERAALFTWERSANATFAVYERAVRRHRCGSA